MMRRWHDGEATVSKTVIWGFESLTACKRLVNKKTYSKHFDYSSIFWIANINNSLL